MLLEFAKDNLWVTLACWGVIYISDYALTLVGARLASQRAAQVSLQGSYELNPYFINDINARRLISPRFLLALTWTVFLLGMIWLLAQLSRLGMSVFELAFGAMILLELAIHMRHLRNIFSYRRVPQPGEMEGSMLYSRRYAFWLSALDLAVFALFYLVLWLFLGNLFLVGGAIACGIHALRHRARMNREPLLKPVAPELVADGGSTT
jgi:hypothetical protein